MLVNEAALLAAVLDRLCPRSILDIGSGTRSDREIIQPHIGAAFRGHMVFWTDMQETPGVVKYDVTSGERPSFLPRCELVTCCSVLEHVTDIDAAISTLYGLARKWAVVSVPSYFPPHGCPIDNQWRPQPDELAERLELAGFKTLEKYSTPLENFNGIISQASMVVAEV